MNQKTVYALIETNYISEETDKFYVDLYEDEETAKQQMKEEVEESMEENESEIIFGSVEEGYVRLRDPQDNVYVFEIEKKEIRGKKINSWKKKTTFIER